MKAWMSERTMFGILLGVVAAVLLGGMLLVGRGAFRSPPAWRSEAGASGPAASPSVSEPAPALKPARTPTPSPKPGRSPWRMRNP
jgi:hypothetical protein